jgi:hypothetical protein
MRERVLQTINEYHRAVGLPVVLGEKYMRGGSNANFRHWTRAVKFGWGSRWLYLLLIGGLLTACGGCHKGPKGMNSPDAACLEALASYNPSHKLNDTGRVIELRLDGKNVDDQALEEVRKLSELRTLSLYNSSVTDNGLTKLSGLTYLEALGLGATPITDRGLISLEKMPSLRWVWLTENKKITDRGVQNLKQKALPGLTVYR